MKRYSRSIETWNSRSSAVLNGVLTMSKSPEYICPNGGGPIYVDRAEGARFWDVDGNCYLDFPLGLGAIVLGHADEEVNEAVIDRIKLGHLFSLSSELELTLAEKLQSLIPCAETVRFLKTGSEAMSAAARIARAYTGKEIIAVCGYHGWHDWTVARSVRNAGVPNDLLGLVKEFKFNDLESLERIFRENKGQVAAVAMEPVAMGEPSAGFLAGVKDLATSNGALLIFDEIITGFRVALGGAQSRFGVTPDIAAFGKAMANGFPISAVVGRHEVFSRVKDRIFISSTHAGDLVGITAALKTIEILERKCGCETLTQLGTRLQEGLNKASKKYRVEAKCVGMPHKTFLVFEEQLGIGAKAVETFFRQECFREGAFLGYGHFTSLAHSIEDIDSAIGIAAVAFERTAECIKSGTLVNQLPGGIAKDVFKRFQ